MFGEHAYLQNVGFAGMEPFCEISQVYDTRRMNHKITVSFDCDVPGERESGLPRTNGRQREKHEDF